MSTSMEWMSLVQESRQRMLAPLCCMRVVCNSFTEGQCLQDALAKLTGWQMLPTVVDLSLLYGSADAAAVQQWDGHVHSSPVWPGQTDGISDADVQLAWILGSRLPARPYGDTFQNVTSPPSHPELPAPPAIQYDSQMQVIEYSNSFPYGYALAFTFTLDGNM